MVQVRNRIPMKQNRRDQLQRMVFHDFDSATMGLMKPMFDIEVMRGVESESAFLKMMMHRRHVFEHNGGVADERYLELSGDHDARLGVLIRETQGNVHRLISGLTRMAKNLDADFHGIFPPTEWPIDYYTKRHPSTDRSGG
jgi:hypothetical protein